MKTFITLIVGLIILGSILYLITSGTVSRGLVSPNFQSLSNQAVSSPTPTPRPTPQSFQFDSNTDLNQELQRVNPKVGTEDFQDLQN